MTYNVFVVGLDRPNRQLLERLPAAQECTFYTLLDFGLLRGVEQYDIDELLAEGRRFIEEADAPPDGICTTIDFPATELVPLFAAERGLPGPSVEGVIACNHKHWSRVLQKESAPEAVPDFAAFDPFRDDALDSIALPYPFWIKPLNAFRSHLGFRIDQPQDFHAALPVIRSELPRLAEPFEKVMAYADLPPEIAREGASRMLAEQIVTGRLCTLEGYVFHGEPHVYGIVDSVRAPNRSSFARYQYPSTLPDDVQRRLTDTGARVIANTGLDDSPFNMEFFYEPSSDEIRVLEINPRLSQSHAPLFELVDGTSHLQVMVDLALGRRPAEPFGSQGRPGHGAIQRHGPYGIAAKFFLRAYRDAVVEAVPDPDDIARIEEDMPGALVHVLVEQGTRLSDLSDQDAYSYELAEVYLGARNRLELLDRWARVRDVLGFGLSTLDADQERWS